MRQVAIRHGRVRAHENLNWPSEFTFYARVRLIYAPGFAGSFHFGSCNSVVKGYCCVARRGLARVQ